MNITEQCLRKLAVLPAHQAIGDTFCRELRLNAVHTVFFGITQRLFGMRPVEGVNNDLLKLFGLGRFDDVVVRAETHRVDDLAQTLIDRQHDNDGRVLFLHKALQHLGARNLAWQMNVADDYFML